MKALLLFVFILSSLSVIGTPLQDGTYFSTFLGQPISAHNKLTLKLNNQTTHQTAHYQSNPLEDSPYYVIRIEKWADQKGWGIEWIHHKLYLQNRPSTISHFSLSDGFNLLLISRSLKPNNWIFRIGGGAVLAHPDVQITGRSRFHTPGFSGNYLAGPALQTSAERWLYESSTHFISFEIKLTAASFNIPISTQSSEYASGIDTAVHFAIGFGSKPIQQRSIKLFGQFISPSLWLGAGMIAAPTN